jgi:hypothetical protein
MRSQVPDTDDDHSDNHDCDERNRPAEFEAKDCDREKAQGCLLAGGRETRPLVGLLGLNTRARRRDQSAIILAVRRCPDIFPEHQCGSDNE